MAQDEVDLIAIVHKVAEYLQDRYRIEDIILFGSWAEGKADPWSDIDLAVTSPEFEGQTLPERVDLAVDVQVACSGLVELHPLSPTAVANARPSNFTGHILRAGKYLMKDGRWVIQDPQAAETR